MTVMITKTITIHLAELTSGHVQEVFRIARDDEPAALDPADCEYLPIVRRATNGYTVVDGFHRLAGMVVGGNGLTVIVVDAPKAFFDQIDCDSVIGECDALDAIYAAAKER